MSNLQAGIPLRQRRRVRRLSDDRINLTRILLTGGPCAGKTTALASISQDLTQLGYKVLVVPEAATTIMKAGAMIATASFTAMQGVTFQKALMKMQTALEDSLVDIGAMVEDQHVVVLVDRGLLDGSAFVSKGAWQALLDELCTSTIMLRENRYDAVVHMVTAADGADSFYETVGNVARWNTAAESVVIDKKLREAYMGHPGWFMIDNTSVDFDAKIARTKDTVHFILGKSQAGSSFYKKFLLKKSAARAKTSTTVPIDLASGQAFEESQVIETFISYCTAAGKVIESSVEKRGSKGAFTYTHKVTLEKHGQRF